MFVSLTRLRIASPLVYPWALAQSLRSARHAAQSAGFRTGALLRAHRRTLWTLTGWDEEAAMRVYRDAGLHRALMPKLLQWCDEAAVAHWTQTDTEPLPTWDDAHARMQARGRPSRVRRASGDHSAFRIGALGPVGAARELPLALLARRAG